MPGKNRASPHEALLFMTDVRERLTLIALSEDEYVTALEEAGSAGISGGAVYDSLIGRCAVKAKAQTIYTWNQNHFQRLGPKIASRVQEP